MNLSNNSEKKMQAKSSREQSVGWMLKAISTGLDQKMISALKPHGINLPQFGIIMTLLEEDGLIQSEIGKKISMPGYATTRNIDALEESGLLERQKNETSRRSYIIRLTDKGRALAPLLFPIVKEINGEALSALDEDETAQLKHLLTKILPQSR